MVLKPNIYKWVFGSFLLSYFNYNSFAFSARSIIQRKGRSLDKLQSSLSHQEDTFHAEPRKERDIFIEEEAKDAWMKDNISKVTFKISKQEQRKDISETEGYTYNVDPEVSATDSTNWFSYELKNLPQVEISKQSEIKKEKEVVFSEWFSYALYSTKKKAQNDSAAWIAKEFNMLENEKEARKRDLVEWYSIASEESACYSPSHTSPGVKLTDRVDWFSFASQQ